MVKKSDRSANNSYDLNSFRVKRRIDLKKTKKLGDELAHFIENNDDAKEYYSSLARN